MQGQREMNWKLNRKNPSCGYNWDVEMNGIYKLETGNYSNSQDMNTEEQLNRHVSRFGLPKTKQGFVFKSVFKCM